MHYILKREPEDFIVEEIPAVEPSGEGEYLLCELTRRNRELEETLAELCCALGIDRKRIGIAGVKDKRAITTQRISLKGVDEQRIRTIVLSRATIRPLAHHFRPLFLGDLAGNRFTIVVRELSQPVAPTPPSQLINYFDAQRFSINNAQIGRALIKRDWRGAVELVLASSPQNRKQIRNHLDEHDKDHLGALMTLPRQRLRLYLHAYPSLLFNRLAAGHIAALGVPSYTLETPLGALCFPTAVIEPVDLPLPGFDTEPDAALAQLLREEGIVRRDFIIRQLPGLSLEGGSRPLAVAVEQFIAEEPQKEGDTYALRLRFTLPKGAYATMLVRQLLAKRGEDG